MGHKQSKITFPTPSLKIKDVVIPLKKIYFPPPKSINKKDLRTSLGYVHDVVGTIPPLKLLTIGITGIADLATNGKATKYLDNGKNYRQGLWCNVLQMTHPMGNLVKLLTDTPLITKNILLIILLISLLKKMYHQRILKKNI